MIVLMRGEAACHLEWRLLTGLSFSGALIGRLRLPWLCLARLCARLLSRCVGQRLLGDP